MAQIQNKSGNKPRRGRPHASEKVDRREALLTSAIKLFAQSGFSMVDLREIAKGADVTVGLIRHYFDSKEGLIDETIANVTGRLEAAFVRITADIDAADGEDFIDIVSQRNNDILLPQYELLQFLKHLAIEMPERSHPIFQTYFRLVKSEIEEMDKRREFNPQLDISWLTFMLMFLQLGPIFLSKQIEMILGVDLTKRDVNLSRSATNAFVLKYGIIGNESTEAE